METLGCPISRVFCEKWGFTFEAAPIFSNGANLHLQHGPVVHPDGSGLIVSIVTKAAPSPVFGLLHQPAPDRIPMNVPQLLNPLMLAPNVVVIESALPNMRGRRLVPQVTHFANGCLPIVATDLISCCSYQRIEVTSAMPNATQKIAFRCSFDSQ